jgi:ABC-2 type transport system ATP-binding protein
MAFTPSRSIDTGPLETLPGVVNVSDRAGRVQLVGDDDSVTAALAWLHAHDITPGRLRVTESTLDDAYLTLTASASEEN